ncbi:TLD domain-containing protein [Cephalotus follicularis]|uniref:TLD domain-containing protein n=1 Tax=Cephalotus follicularis TaxID=3775 RepID=A0A1Q3D7A7_CEPFO|nr:TLD domain-containing protein [Cephalotus follicularis]
MYTLKEKVTERLSRFLADSTNSASSPSTPSPPDPLQARPYSKEERSLFSYVSFILPSTISDASKSNKHQPDFKPIQSLPLRWRRKDFQQKDEPFDNYKQCAAEYKSEEFQKVCEDDKECIPVSDNKLDKECSPGRVKNLKVSTRNVDHSSGRSSSDSDVFEEATDQQSPGKPLPCLTVDSAFVSSDLYEFLKSSLPNIVKGCQWVLLYSTWKHGISLRTLIRNSAGLPGPCLLIVGDMQGAVFGGMLECPLKPTPKRKYQGTHQTFVFTTIYGEPRLFRPTGANRYYLLCMNDLIALGGGGNFALRLDEDLLTGTSGSCETFGNLCLAHNSEFDLKNVELWGFTHASQCHSR